MSLYGILSPPTPGDDGFLEISGRKYACPANASIPAPEADALILKANGWTLVKWTGDPVADLAAPLVAEGGALRTDLTVQNPLNGVLWKLKNGQSAVIQGWTDSTGIASATGVVGSGGDRRWVAQWADQLSARIEAVQPGTGIRLFSWVVAQNSYHSTGIETIKASSNGIYLDIYLGAVAGTPPAHLLGSLFMTALGSVPADALIMAHGINLNTHPAEAIAGAYAVAFEQYRTVHPAALIGAFTQHPHRDSTAYDGVRAILKANASRYGVAVNDAPFQEFLDAGKPVNWYVDGDPVHESVGPGCQPYIRAMNAWWDTAYPTQSVLRPSRLIMPAARQQLIVNGDFSVWTNTASVPDGWTQAAGNITFSKDTANYADERKPFSVKMIGTGVAQTVVTQPVSAAKRALVGGRNVFLSGLIKKELAGSYHATLGRIGLSWAGSNNDASPIGGPVNTVGYADKGDGFAWWGLVAKMPDIVSALTVNVYHDSAGPPDLVNAVYLDQISLTIGGMPACFR